MPRAPACTSHGALRHIETAARPHDSLLPRRMSPRWPLWSARPLEFRDCAGPRHAPSTRLLNAALPFFLPVQNFLQDFLLNLAAHAAIVYTCSVIEFPVVSKLSRVPTPRHLRAVPKPSADFALERYRARCPVESWAPLPNRRAQKSMP